MRSYVSVLASIIANLQNLPQAEVSPPVVKIDRGGGGPLWGPGYDVVDILAAAQSFPEVAGEDPIARTVRRLRWIGEALPKIKEAREKREGGAFLTGVQFGYGAGYDAAVAERSPARERPQAGAITPVRAPVMPRRAPDRGQHEGSGGTGFIVAALAIGAVALIARRRHR